MQAIPTLANHSTRLIRSAAVNIAGEHFGTTGVRGDGFGALSFLTLRGTQGVLSPLRLPGGSRGQAAREKGDGRRSRTLRDSVTSCDW